LFIMFPGALLLALDRSVYKSLKGELDVLVNSAGDVWAYSGKGGYVFKFEKDVSGGPENEIFVNFSVRPNVWQVFAGGENKILLGEVEFASFDFIYSKKENGQSRILRSYEADSYAVPPFEPFGKYVLAQIITESGIDSEILKVGVDTPKSKFDDLKFGVESENISWASPDVQVITLESLLLESDASWFSFEPDEAYIKYGYYRLRGDEARFSAFESSFTPKVALEALNQKLSVTIRSENDAALSSSDSTRPRTSPVLPSPDTAEKSTLQPTTSLAPETESSSGLPFMPVAIFVAVILGIALLIIHWKSKKMAEK